MPSVELDLTRVPDTEPEMLSKTPEEPPAVLLLLTDESSSRNSPDPEPNPPAFPLPPTDDDEKKEPLLFCVKMFFSSRLGDPELLDMPLLADELKPRGGKDVTLVVEIVVSVKPLSPELPPE